MADRDPSKTEQATGKRVKKARDEGNVPRSAEVGKVVVLIAGLFAIKFSMGWIGTNMIEIFRTYFSMHVEQDLSQAEIYSMLLALVKKLAIMLLPTLFSIAIVAYVSIRVQVGELWVSKFLNPDFSRVFNLGAGLKALMFDVKALVRMGRQLAQAIAIGVPPYLILKREYPNFMPLFYQNAEGLAAYILNSAYMMCLYAMMPMLLIAAADLWYTRWDYNENLKMTKDEVKDEHKQAEGDPVVKSQQRMKMFEVMKKRMLKNVPKADVVITNPTHFAVALQYDPKVAPAPLVVAKGADLLAQRIKEIARENNVPIRENKPLAQALYKSVEIGETIPEELFQAVAAILAQLQKFKRVRR